jgi:hypothetical protein
VLKNKILLAATILVFTAITISVVTSGLLTAQQAVPLSGIVSSIGISVYNDAATTTICTGFDCGNLKPGSVKTQTIYVKNTGNITETLHMTTTDWNPSTANTILTLTWDKEDRALAAGSVVEATLTLTVPEDTGSLSNFNCNIIIEGTA